MGHVFNSNFTLLLGITSDISNSLYIYIAIAKHALNPYLSHSFSILAFMDSTLG
jgi:hypothetical protein